MPVVLFKKYCLNACTFSCCQNILSEFLKAVTFLCEKEEDKLMLHGEDSGSIF